MEPWEEQPREAKRQGKGADRVGNEARSRSSFEDLSATPPDQGPKTYFATFPCTKRSFCLETISHEGKSVY